ncbi:MAG: alpha/beta fold hydrolase [Pseudomonadota bacterium]
MRAIGMIALLAAVLYLAACAALFAFQRSLIYHPQPAADGSGSTLRLAVADAEVIVSTRPHAGPGAIVYFGGNAEDATQSLPALAAAFPDQAIYLLHYRGYGGSSGAPSELAIAGDALALFDQLHARHGRISVIGRSLGSGVAIRLASERPVARLVLVTPFDSLEQIAAAHFPFLPVRALLRDKFQSWRYAPRIAAPTLLIAAQDDEVIPRASTDLLLTRFGKGIARLEVVASSSHNSIAQRAQYVRLLRTALSPD